MTSEDRALIVVPKELRTRLKVRAAEKGIPIYRLIEELLAASEQAKQGS